MNLEQTQRVNELAKELLAHGMAANSEEATKKAEDIIRRAVPSTSTEQSTPEVEQLQSTLAYLKADLKNIAFEIEKLGNAYKSLKADVVEVKKSINSQLLSAESPGKQQPVKNETAFSEEDVAIDKVFYSGQK